LQRFHRAWLDSLPQGIPQRRLDVLSLGVTPEIAQFPWATDTQLTAIDASEEMIQKVWPGNDATRKAVLGNWLALPFDDASFDLILNDAGLLLMAGAEKLRAAAEELRRVLRPEGRVVLRHFARVSPAESLGAIAEDVEHGRVSNFNELKLRLLMAIESGKAGAGVRLAEAYECFQQLFPDHAQLASRLGCDPRTVATIEAYRGREARYTFHSLDEMAQAFEGFTLQIGPTGHYPAAERCPVLVFTPKS
jgi:SAM-dependent methyltransferase